jgi:hypothetical protein
MSMLRRRGLWCAIILMAGCSRSGLTVPNSSCSVVANGPVSLLPASFLEPSITLQRQLYSFDVDGGHVYFAYSDADSTGKIVDAGIARIASDGGAVETVISDLKTPGYFRVRNGVIAWQPDMQTIRVRDRQNASFVIGAPRGASSISLWFVDDAGDVYLGVTGTVDPSFPAFPKWDHTTQQIVDVYQGSRMNAPWLGEQSFDDDVIFGTTSSATGGFALVSLPTRGGTFSTLVTSPDKELFLLSSDATNIYFYRGQPPFGDYIPSPRPRRPTVSSPTTRASIGWAATPAPFSGWSKRTATTSRRWWPNRQGRIRSQSMRATSTGSRQRR